MKNTVEIVILADIPDDQPDLGHEAVLATKEAVQGIVQALHKMGLVTARPTRRILRKKAPADTAVLPTKPAAVQLVPTKPAA